MYKNQAANPGQDDRYDPLLDICRKVQNVQDGHDLYHIRSVVSLGNLEALLEDLIW